MIALTNLQTAKTCIDRNYVFASSGDTISPFYRFDPLIKSINKTLTQDQFVDSYDKGYGFVVYKNLPNAQEPLVYAVGVTPHFRVVVSPEFVGLFYDRELVRSEVIKIADARINLPFTKLLPISYISNYVTLATGVVPERYVCYDDHLYLYWNQEIQGGGLLRASNLCLEGPVSVAAWGIDPSSFMVHPLSHSVGAFRKRFLAGTSFDQCPPQGKDDLGIVFNSSIKNAALDTFEDIRSGMALSREQIASWCKGYKKPEGTVVNTDGTIIVLYKALADRVVRQEQGWTLTGVDNQNYGVDSWIFTFESARNARIESWINNDDPASYSDFAYILGDMLTGIFKDTVDLFNKAYADAIYSLDGFLNALGDPTQALGAYGDVQVKIPAVNLSNSTVVDNSLSETLKTSGEDSRTINLLPIAPSKVQRMKITPTGEVYSSAVNYPILFEQKFLKEYENDLMTLGFDNDLLQHLDSRAMISVPRSLESVKKDLSDGLQQLFSSKVTDKINEIYNDIIGAFNLGRATFKPFSWSRPAYFPLDEKGTYTTRYEAGYWRPLGGWFPLWWEFIKSEIQQFIPNVSVSENGEISGASFVEINGSNCLRCSDDWNMALDKVKNAIQGKALLKFSAPECPAIQFGQIEQTSEGVRIPIKVSVLLSNYSIPVIHDDISDRHVFSLRDKMMQLMAEGTHWSLACLQSTGNYIQGDASEFETVTVRHANLPPVSHYKAYGCDDCYRPVPGSKYRIESDDFYIEISTSELNQLNKKQITPLTTSVATVEKYCFDTMRVLSQASAGRIVASQLVKRLEEWVRSAYPEAFYIDENGEERFDPTVLKDKMTLAGMFGTTICSLGTFNILSGGVASAIHDGIKHLSTLASGNPSDVIDPEGLTPFQISICQGVLDALNFNIKPVDKFYDLFDPELIGTSEAEVHYEFFGVYPCL